ncbi:hypothetical protein BGZ93_004188, partial [Podila epicladia]
MSDISNEDYDLARWRWCTEVMGKTTMGDHDLMLSMEDVFLDHVSGLVSYIADTSTSCNNLECPERHDIKSSTFHSVIMRDTCNITQSTLNEALEPHSAPCSVEIEIPQGTERRSRRLQHTFDVDNDTARAWYSCSGIRTSDRMTFIQVPAMLLLDCIQSYDYNKPQVPTTTPTPVLTIDGNVEYQLAAIMYGNGSHFCCTVFINGGALFYDGMKKPKLRWLVPNKITHPKGFRFVHV